MGNDKTKSKGTTAVCSSIELAGLVTQMKLKFPGIGCMRQIKTSTSTVMTRSHVIAIRQSTIQLSIINSFIFIFFIKIVKIFQIFNLN